MERIVRGISGAFVRFVILNFGISVAVTLFVMKGIPRHFSVQLPGVSISDSGFMAGYFSTLRTSGINPFANDVNQFIGWPFGIQNHGTLNLTSSLSVGVVWVIGNLIGVVPAQLVTSILGVFFSSFIGGIAIWRLTGNAFSSLLATLTLGTAPMMMQWWSANPPYCQNWIFVLVLWSCCKVTRGDRRAHVYLGLATVVAILWAQYIGVFCVILSSVCLLLTEHTRKSWFKWLSALGPSAVVVSVYFGMGLVEREQVPVRNHSDAALLALNFGKVLDSQLAVYFPVALVSIALFGMLTRRHQTGVKESRLLMLFSTQLVALALLFSTPRIGWLPLPGSLISGAVTQLRSGWYAAQPIQVLLIFLCCLIVGGQIYERSGYQRLLAVALVFVAVVDNYRIPLTEQVRWMREATTSEEVVSRLKESPPGAVAHFPWELSNEASNHPEPTPCLFQLEHRHPLVNTCGIVFASNDQFSFINEIRARSGCDQLNYLRLSGVRYVVVELSPLQPILMQCLDEQSRHGNATRLVLDSKTNIELWQLLD